MQVGGGDQSKAQGEGPAGTSIPAPVRGRFQGQLRPPPQGRTSGPVREPLPDHGCSAALPDHPGCRPTGRSSAARAAWARPCARWRFPAHPGPLDRMLRGQDDGKHGKGDFSIGGFSLRLSLLSPTGKPRVTRTATPAPAVAGETLPAAPIRTPSPLRPGPACRLPAAMAGSPDHRRGRGAGSMDGHITLGGAGRERDHALRADPAGLASAQAEGATLVLWRGRPLVTPDDAGPRRQGLPGSAGCRRATPCWRTRARPSSSAGARTVARPSRQTCRTGSRRGAPAGRPLRPRRHPAPAGARRRRLRGPALRHDRPLPGRGRGRRHRPRPDRMAPRPRLLRRLRPAQPARTRRLAAPLPRLRHRPLPPHRPGRDHAGHPRQLRPPRPQPRLARGDVFLPRRLHGTRRDGSRRPPRGGRGDRHPRRPRALPRQPALALPGLAHARLPGRGPDDDITLDPEELEDALWIGREELVTVMAGTHPRLRAPRKGAIAAHLVAMWLEDRAD